MKNCSSKVRFNTCVSSVWRIAQIQDNFKFWLNFQGYYRLKFCLLSRTFSYAIKCLICEKSSSDDGSINIAQNHNHNRSETNRSKKKRKKKSNNAGSNFLMIHFYIQITEFENNEQVKLIETEKQRYSGGLFTSIFIIIYMRHICFCHE